MSELQPAYIIHTRQYRDSSVILDLLSRQNGRFAVVVKGARAEKSRYRGRLQLFTPLLVATTGRGELKTATSIEFPGRQYRLEGESLFLGLYVNELLYRLLGKFDPVDTLFDHYDALLEMLQNEDVSLTVVRAFELQLLEELGYGVNFEYDSSDGERVEPEWCYQYVVHEGFRRISNGTGGEGEGTVFPGTELLQMSSGEFNQVDSKRLRYLTRSSLTPLLGDRPLKSRSLFRQAAR